ncbi:hypothetical protein V6N13_048030 [Hibiscus sabdariffa]|uniref:Uncharacterized protein n=1 Tax=Hibiscus sabdariffa TaxID=183260 RepID=A0ABR2F602_9ROSI
METLYKESLLTMQSANIELSHLAGVLNYDKKEDGSLLLFRPEQHAIRMKIGVERMSMPSPSIDQFIHAAKQTAFANNRWVPPPRKGSLYIRPLLFRSGPILGVGPAPKFMFLTHASPVGNYFKMNRFEHFSVSWWSENCFKLWAGDESTSQG